MADRQPTPRTRTLVILLLAYGSASLIHFAHNAVFLGSYPNMPQWLTSFGVYGAWLAITSLGVAGYAMFRRGYLLSGLAVLAAYGVLGFGGLDHYALAPPSAHSFAMNFTIWFEVATAALLLIGLAATMARPSR